MRSVSFTPAVDPEVAPSLSPGRGTYALILRCTKGRTVQVGRLGGMQLRAGFYVYVGSGLGPGGLRARIAPHLRRARRPHWHIDYLRAYTRPDQLWFCCDVARREHHWARASEAAPGASIHFPGVGAPHNTQPPSRFHRKLDNKGLVAMSVPVIRVSQKPPTRPSTRMDLMTLLASYSFITATWLRDDFHAVRRKSTKRICLN